jgi:alpha-beta hydrolase superfamily lysophospholipase
MGTVGRVAGACQELGRPSGSPSAAGVTRLVLAVAAAVVLAVAACGGSESRSGPAAPAPGDRAAAVADAATIESGRPFPVRTVTQAFVDRGRPTDDPDDQRDAPTRTLETTVHLPDAEGPFPLVVHAHGFEGHPRKYTELAGAWAAAGYVVALPAFPLTNDASGGDGVVQDYVNQPADVTFVIDELLALSAGDDPVLGGRIDPERVGVSGHSLGGATVYGLAFNDCCRDERLDAVILMSSLTLPFEDAGFELSGVPLLMLQLTEDPLVPYEAATTAYGQAAAPRFLVTLEGGVHAEPYEDAPSPHDDLVVDTTTAFWDAYLLDDDTAVDRLLGAVDAADLASVTADP